MKPWKLNESNFSILDRLKIAAFFLNPKNNWTFGQKCAEFEDKMADYVGCKHAIFVSSGSTANTMLAMLLKDSESNKKVVVFPSTTWTTSVAPFLREGFTPQFIDVNLYDYSIDLNLLEDYLDSHKDEVAAVFVTSLIGFVPDMARLERIARTYNVRVMMDNCENTMGTFEGRNVSSFFTSTTSTYFGHQLQSVEGGFVFTKNDEERDLFLMYRNHGMTRHVVDKKLYSNKGVDPRFDFFLLGNNFRNSDIHAFIGLLDSARLEKLKQKRLDLYEYFLGKIANFDRYPYSSVIYEHVPFCLPLFFDKNSYKFCAMSFCEKNGIETRPIISGNLLRQTCYKNFGTPSDFPNSEYLHEKAFYVGLHNSVTKEQIDFLTSSLRKFGI
jgi:CDP-6-deoxy-D-xylo-4-hexulose-3-dehydrase